jgi:hypothetical protein
MSSLVAAAGASPGDGGSGGGSPVSAFRPMIALTMLYKHDFASFREYLRAFPIDAKNDMALHARFEIQRAMSHMFDIIDTELVTLPTSPLYNCSTLVDVRPAAHPTFSTTGSSASSAVAPFYPDHFIRESLPIFERLDRLFPHCFTPLALSDPALYVMHRFSRVWADILGGNIASREGLVHVSTTAPTNFVTRGAQQSLRDLFDEATGFLDELNTFQALESETNAPHAARVLAAAAAAAHAPLASQHVSCLGGFQVWLLHIQVITLWLLAVVSSRTRLATLRHRLERDWFRVQARWWPPMLFDDIMCLM